MLLRFLVVVFAICVCGCARLPTTQLDPYRPTVGQTTERNRSQTTQSREHFSTSLGGPNNSLGDASLANPSQSYSKWWDEFDSSSVEPVAWFDDTDFGYLDVYSQTNDLGQIPFPESNYSPALQIRSLPPVEKPQPRQDYSDFLHEQMVSIVGDHSEFYSRGSLTWLTYGLALGAGMANTGFDEHFIRDSYVDSIVLAPSDEIYEFAHQPKFFGEGQFTIPVFALLALSGPFIEDWPMGPEAAEWGQRSFRTVLVGGPPLLGLQLVTGGSRPGESLAKSHWKPFQNSHGVSGHSFMGAVPFMSAAKMTDNPWCKAGFYALSTLPALSRINDDDHYFSQAFLGWWLAYISATAVDQSQQNGNFHFCVYPQKDGFGVGLEVIQ